MILCRSQQCIKISSTNLGSILRRDYCINSTLNRYEHIQSIQRTWTQSTLHMAKLQPLNFLGDESVNFTPHGKLKFMAQSTRQQNIVANTCWTDNDASLDHNTYIQGKIYQMTHCSLLNSYTLIQLTNTLRNEIQKW